MENGKILAVAAAVLFAAVAATPANALSSGELLGKKLFFDKNLSANGTQSCADCHASNIGFTGPSSQTNAGGAIYEGALPSHYGNRKPPTSAYAGDSPMLHQDGSGEWYGGMFWDGRAAGAVLGDALAEQAQGPYLNPLEQAAANARVLCSKVKKAEYAPLFDDAWGAGALDCSRNAEKVYELIGRSVAAYERSAEVNPFTSKFDMFWDNAAVAGKDVTKIKCGTDAMGCPGDGSDPNRWTTFRNLGLTDEELQGFAIFTEPTRANCASCHPLHPGPNGYPLFTDFSYDNLGIPKNPLNPFYTMPRHWNPDGEDWVDYGLGDFLKSAGYAAGVYDPEMGKFKVPTLRNVDLRPTPDTVKAYGHNGYFKSLDEIVFFYHWRAMMDSGCSVGGTGGGGMADCDLMAEMFSPPEVDRNRTTLPMFPRPQVDSIVAFLKTLSDGYYQK